MALDVAYEIETKIVDDKEYDLACFVLLANNNINPNGKPFYSLDLLGKPTFEWVTRVCPTRPITLECENDDNPLQVIKPYLREREYTLVLFGDTPLLTRQNINNILDFVASKGLNVCKLSRGYVFKTDYIKRVDEIFAPQTYYFNEEEFQVASNLFEFAKISRILQDRIVRFHQSRGVEFTNPKQVYIESDVAIGAGTKIEPNVYLSGETEIGANATICEGCKIVSSKIGNSSQILCAKIYNSVIKENCQIGDFVVIDGGSFIGAGSFVGASCVIDASSLSQNVKIGANSNLKFARIYRDAKVGNSCCISGEQEQLARILHGSTLGDFCLVSSGVAVKEQNVVPSGTILTLNSNEN